MNNFPVTDGVVLLILVVFFLRSFFRGALKEVTSLLSIFIGYASATYFGPVFEDSLRLWVSSSWSSRSAAFTIVFVVVWLLASIAGRLVLHFTGASPTGYLNRILGGVIGLGKGVFFLSVAYVTFLSVAPSLMPGPRSDERVMPIIRHTGEYIRQASVLELGDQVELIKKTMSKSFFSSE
jgi:membrane protein required for colicin V production